MERNSVHTKKFIWWCWSIIGAVLLLALPSCAQVAKGTSQTKVIPPQQMTGDPISIRPLSTWSEGRIPREPKVSIVGDQIHIEIFSPAVIKIHPAPEPPTVKSELEHLRYEVRASRGPIVIAPTP